MHVFFFCFLFLDIYGCYDSRFEYEKEDSVSTAASNTDTRKQIEMHQFSKQSLFRDNSKNLKKITLFEILQYPETFNKFAQHIKFLIFFFFLSFMYQ